MTSLPIESDVGGEGKDVCRGTFINQYMSDFHVVNLGHDDQGGIVKDMDDLKVLIGGGDLVGGDL